MILPWYHGLFYILFCGEHVFFRRVRRRRFDVSLFFGFFPKRGICPGCIPPLPTVGRVRFFFLTFFMFSETDVFRPEDADGGRRSVAAGRRFRFLLFFARFIFIPSFCINLHRRKIRFIISFYFVYFAHFFLLSKYIFLSGKRLQGRKKCAIIKDTCYHRTEYSCGFDRIRQRRIRKVNRI